MTDDHAGTITQWIAAAKDGNEEAFTRLWDHLCGELKRAAKARLPAASRRVADEEDALLSAFAEFWRAAVNQQYPDVVDRNDLRALLLVITVRKAIKHAIHENRIKRGGGRVHKGLPAHVENSIPDAMSRSNPELSVIAADEVERLMAILESDDLRQVAQLRLDGCTIEDIAEKIDRTLATVNRRLSLIRARWLLDQAD